MLRLAIPSKGRLQAQTAAWFAARGLRLERSGAEREYAAHLAGVDGVQILLMSATDIAAALLSGQVHLGVTGQDVLRERRADWAARVAERAALDFGHADLVIAVPAFWVDVDTLDDLDAVAAAFRARHGHRLRIATKYHRLVREFLQRAGVADYLLVDSQGATEAAVRQETAEAIADITSSGETLRANHLKVLSDGLILRSQAVLFESRVARWDAAARSALAALERRTLDRV